ncbi:MAG: hypothetical protein HW416_1144, partial [Chloroflexi bacterium]|nr:hypothetical protein [Chloroflexota bacterium]
MYGSQAVSATRGDPVRLELGQPRRDVLHKETPGTGTLLEAPEVFACHEEQ